MANTNLPEALSGSSTGHIGHTNVVHSEINLMTRDTGSVDITAALRNGWTSQRVTYNRRDQEVYLRFEGLSGTSATSTTVLEFSGIVPPAIAPHSNDLPMNTGLYLNNVARDDPAFFTFQDGASPFLQCRLASNGAASGVVSLGGSTFYIRYRTGRGWYGDLPTP